MLMRPADHRFFLKEDHKPQTTETGIFIGHSTAKVPTVTGVVTEVGKGCQYVKQGDRVVVHRKGSVRMDDILVIAENPDKVLVCG